jgi:DNA-binding transcriptional MerR regulator
MGFRGYDMKDYLSIGKVAKRKGVSIKSLRYYDEIGILKPAYVNQATNYRYYKEEQLFLIDAITLCIELGIPLKNLPGYRAEDGSWDFQRLLFDGKALAEEKIRSMRNSIDALQTTLRRIEAGELDPNFVPEAPKVKAPDPADSTDPVPASPHSALSCGTSALPEGVAKESLEHRRLLLVPFDIATSIEHYNHKLLELFVGANKIGLETTYPAGLYYEQKSGVLSRYVFVYLAKSSFSFEGNDTFLVRDLPAGDFLCSKNSVHRIEDAKEIFGDCFDSLGDHILLEQAVTDQASRNTLFEIQFPL